MTVCVFTAPFPLFHWPSATDFWLQPGAVLDPPVVVTDDLGAVVDGAVVVYPPQALRFLWLFAVRNRGVVPAEARWALTNRDGSEVHASGRTHVIAPGERVQVVYAFEKAMVGGVRASAISMVAGSQIDPAGNPQLMAWPAVR